MAIWIDGYELSVGEVGFLIECVPEGRATRYHLNDRPPYTNLSHEPRLHGWCGTTDNVARYGHGMARVTRVARNGRALVVPLHGQELVRALEDAGFPGLAPTD